MPAKSISSGNSRFSIFMRHWYAQFHAFHSTDLFLPRTSTARLGFESEAFVYNALIHICATLGWATEAYPVFDDRTRSDLVTWNYMLPAYAQQDDPLTELEFFTGVTDSGLQPNVSSIAFFIGDTQSGQSSHCFILTRGWTAENMFWNDLGLNHIGLRMEKLLQETKYVAVCEHIIGYGSFMQDFINFCLMFVNGRLLPYTMHIHNQMQILNVPTDFLTYTILFIAYCLAGSVRRAQDIYEAIKLVGSCRYNFIPYSRIIKVSVEATMWHFAREIQAETVSKGVRPSVVTWSSLLSDFATADLEECAIHTVDKMLLLGYEPS
ncbi:pentatricopeptide repeat-containing protein At5g02860-like [Aristolochia californica]|uniref:pentatricopeptide repeat-containing protein At5g02860-like n=1 Tax=Aristolochia californica TaxID=171875 RepID=UPI0035DD6B50